jgi:hypothetical protein
MGSQGRGPEWEVEFTDQFEAWWDDLTVEEQDSIAESVNLLRAAGPALARPHSDTLKGTRVSNMKELRVQHHGRPLRILYAFDPRRAAILLLGGEKTGDARWYEVHLPLAERLYAEHLDTLRREGLIE